MVAFFCPPPFMRPTGNSPLTISNLGGISYPTTFGSTSVWSSLAVGNPSADRYILFVVMDYQGTVASAVTVNGSPATIFATLPTGGGAATIGGALIPAGTTATVGVTFSGGRSDLQVLKYICVTGNASLQMVAASGAGSAGFANRSLTLNSSPGGVLLFGSHVNSTGTGVSVSGAYGSLSTQRIAIGQSQATGSSALTTDAGTTVTPNVASSYNIFGATFR